MRELMAKVQSEYELPGIVIGILRDGNVSCYTSGYLNDQKSDAVTCDTAYGIGSISKVFTATLAMTLVADNQLDLHQPIVEYLPDIPISDDQCRKNITMYHLLTHTGGFEGDGFIENGTDESALAEWVAGFTDLEQVTPTGAIWSYSNTGIGLAGHVLARVCGSTYEEAMQTRVLKPLGLERTGFGQPPALPNSSTGYEFGKEGNREPRKISGAARSANPAGGLVSTVPDLLRFAKFHLGLDSSRIEHIMPDELKLEMQKPQADVSLMEKWGIGWGLKLEGESTWTVEHGGWFNGFRAQLTLMPEYQSAFAILTTGPKGHEAIEHLQEEIFSQEFGILPVASPSTYVGSKPHYTGIFKQSHLRAEFLIDEQTDELELRLKTKWHGAEKADPISCPLNRLSTNEYVVTEGEFIRSRITFIDNIPGMGVTGVRVLNRICLPEYRFNNFHISCNKTGREQ